MKASRWLAGWMIVVASVALSGSAWAQTIIWTNPANGFWQDSTSWLPVGPPLDNGSFVLITNVNTKTVTINAATPATNLTIQSLQVGLGNTNTLALSNPGTNTPLRLRGGGTINTAGALTATNAYFESYSAFKTQGGGSALFEDCLVVVTNTFSTAAISAGDTGGGTITIRGGTLLAGILNAGGNTANVGTFTMFNCTGVVGQVRSGVNAGTTGALWMTSSQIISTVQTMEVGMSGLGQVTLSNSTLKARNISIGDPVGGTLTIAGGLLDHGPFSMLLGASGTVGTGRVWMLSGNLYVTNSALVVGSSSVGIMSVSNGTVFVRDLQVSSGISSRGTFNVAGGLTLVTNILTIGGFDSGITPTGLVTMTGGTLTVTNPVTNAWLSVRRGTLTFNSGTIIADKLTVTNPVTAFNFNGGTLIIKSSIISNGQPFVVGNGTSPATLNLRGGSHKFVNGLLVSSNAALAEVGVIVGSLTNSGTLSPGSSPGVITVTNGNLTLLSGSTLDMELGGTNQATEYDFIRVFGSTSLTGMLRVSFINGFGSLVTSNDVFTLLQANSNLTGTFTNIASGARLLATDGAHDFLVLYAGTNSVILKDAKLADTDGDGIPNYWTLQYFGHPTGQAGDLSRAGDDPDGDGFTNLQEYLAGTDPTNAASAPTVTSWNTSASGKWETDVNWSAGAPAIAFQQVFITNATTKTVTIDAITAATNSGSAMTISNLLMSAPTGATNILSVIDSGASVPLRILNSFTMTSGGSLAISNGAVQVDKVSISTISLTDDGDILLNSPGARLVNTNGNLHIGDFARGTMTVSNGTVLAEDVIIANSVGSQGTLTIAGGTNRLSGVLDIGGDGTGSVWMTGGQLLVTNTTTLVGNAGVGRMTLSNGAVLAQAVSVANLAGSQGTLTVAGGTTMLSSDLTIGRDANATGAVTVAGGNLFVTNAAGTATLVVGQSGRGVYIQNGGTVTVDQLVVTNNLTDAVFQLLGGTLFTKATSYSNVVLNVGTAGSSATLNFQGATHSLLDALRLAPSAGSAGTVWMTANQLMVGSTDIGLNGVGQMTVSNGTWQVGGLVRVGVFGNSRGTLTIAGGTGSVFSTLTIGDFPCTPTGTVVVAGGNFFVTNATASAVLEVRTGSLILNSGLLTINKFVMTNACGNFVRTGGTLVYDTAVLDPARDDDGDGLPNGWEQQYGLDPLDSTGDNGAAGDPDGDGLTNLQEFQAGSNPVADIKSITKEGDDIRVTWQAAATKTNALQRTDGDSGSYSNNFADIFIVTNSLGSVTNYLDVGAATNAPAFYYRVRLVP